MATLDGIEFTGSLGGFSAYRMRGSDKIILRKKGGPSRKQVLTGKNFVRLRENMKEFSGAGKLAGALRLSLVHVKHLAGHNITATLTKVCNMIQQLDPVGDRGQRSIFLSRHRFMLAGFRLNEKQPFQSIVTGPVGCTLNRKTKSAKVTLPSLIPGINLHLPWKQPLYRFCLSLGVVSDVVYERGDYDDHHQEVISTELDTAWHVVKNPFQSQTLELKLDLPKALKDTQTLVFAIGIEMGALGPNGEIDAVKYAGSACILVAG